MSDKLEKLLNQMKSDPKLAKNFEKDPESFLRSHDIDPENLPKEFLDNLSGGFIMLAINAWKAYSTYKRVDALMNVAEELKK